MGGRAPDADPLDEEDHRGGGPHGPAAGPDTLHFLIVQHQGGDVLVAFEASEQMLILLSGICFEVSSSFIFLRK